MEQDCHFQFLTIITCLIFIQFNYVVNEKTQKSCDFCMFCIYENAFCIDTVMQMAVRKNLDRIFLTTLKTLGN